MGPLEPEPPRKVIEGGCPRLVTGDLLEWERRRSGKKRFELASTCLEPLPRPDGLSPVKIVKEDPKRIEQEL